MPLHERSKHLERPGKPYVVTVEKDEIVAACRRRSAIASRAWTCIRLTDDGHAFGAVKNLDGPICRPIINDDHFVRTSTLR